jgi:hypothetical protein
MTTVTLNDNEVFDNAADWGAGGVADGHKPMAQLAVGFSPTYWLTNSCTVTLALIFLKPYSCPKPCP